MIEIELPEGIQNCTCYRANPDDVDAYFSGYTNHEIGKGPDYINVQIKTRGGEWIETFRQEGDITTMRFAQKALEWKVAGEILSSYCGGQKLVGHTALAKKLRDWPGHDLRRLTPDEIREFLLIQGHR